MYSYKSKQKQKQRQRQIVQSILYTATILVFFAACAPKEEENKPVENPTTTSAVPPTAPIQLLNPEYEVSVPGELKPYEQVAIYAKVSGFVKELNVDRGDRVRKGQRLALLEAPEMQQQYLSDQSIEQKAYSDYRYAQQAYDRLVEAAKTDGAVASIEVDRAKSALESTKSAYDATKASTAHASQLQNYLRLTAPFDGVITQRNVSVGALVGTAGNAPLLVMAQNNKVRLTVSLSEKHASSVQQSTEATFTISSQPGKTYQTHLSRTSNLLDANNRSLVLEFDVDNTQNELQGGDYAQVKLKLKRKSPSYWVDSKSVLRTQMGTFVLTLNQNEIKRIPVTEGIRLDDLVEVFGALAETDQIIVKPTEEMKEGVL